MKENEIVKAVRMNERMTQRDFGKKFSMTDTAISLMESGRRGVNSEVMNYCLEKLNTQPVSRKDVIEKILRSHIGTYDSFIDSDGHNHFEELVNDLTLFV